MAAVMGAATAAEMVAEAMAAEVTALLLQQPFS